MFFSSNNVKETARELHDLIVESNADALTDFFLCWNDDEKRILLHEKNEDGLNAIQLAASKSTVAAFDCIDEELQSLGISCFEQEGETDYNIFYFAGLNKNPAMLAYCKTSKTSTTNLDIAPKIGIKLIN